jgi:hypothetical protein
MKILISISLFFIPIQFFAQSTYWQQKVDYSIEATIDDKNNQLNGDQTLVYFNNSPDTLHEIYFHLYWNAFKKGSHAFERQAALSNSQVLAFNSDEYGEITIQSLRIEGEVHSINVFESIGQIKLNKQLLPGKSVNISIQFVSKIPACINRAGKNNVAGTDFTFTQWYPKICRYDNMGWHTDPYFGREFAGTFGNFAVQVLCDSSFTVAGTGVLKDKSYKTKGWKPATSSREKTNLERWEFVAENVHDFAFALEKEWNHEELIIDGITFHFFYGSNYKDAWKSLILNWPKAYAICKEEFGKYPYPQFSFIQAGEGYMEYPMCTMLESGRSDFFSTACHEFMHNFFYGIYGTDENLYHWMDEGLTSYAEERISNVNKLTKNPASGAIANYNWITDLYIEEPISTAANHFDADYPYYNAAYYKGQLFPELIRYIIGDSTMRAGFSRYYSKWKFKQPDPTDFVKTFEDVSRMELTWFQNYWLNTTKKIDFSIDSVFKSDEGITIVVENKGIPMPLEFSIQLKNGNKKYYYIPLDLTNNVKSNFLHPTEVLEKWSCARRNYTITLSNIKWKELKSIQLDPDGFMPDLNPANNQYEKQ